MSVSADLPGLVGVGLVDPKVLHAELLGAEKALERDIGVAKTLARKVQAAQADAEEARLSAQSLEEAGQVLNAFADSRQVEVINRIEGLVTYGLRTVFYDHQDLSFRVLVEEKARRSEVRFVVSSPVPGEASQEALETPVLDARGGGVAAVAGFLLRLVVLLLRPPTHTRHLLVLDETFAHVSAEYERRLVEFVAELVAKTDVQVVLVTHKAVEDWVEVADKAYRFTLVNGRTTVKALK